jgi:CheY-like chemotaxis protein
MRDFLAPLERGVYSSGRLRPAFPGKRERSDAVAERDKSILVVDDEPDVLDVLVGLLASEAYTVLAANGSAEALALIARKCVDLLLTDVRMPGDLDGFGLARAAKARCPGLEVIYVSGWVQHPPKRGEFVLGPLLNKPLLPEMLARTVRQVLKLN